MKKITLFLGILSIITIVSCKKKEEMPVPPPPAPTESSVPTPEAPKPVVEDNKDGTSIKVGKDGVDISTKDGANKTSVNVSNGDAKVEIKK